MRVCFMHLFGSASLNLVSFSKHMDPQFELYEMLLGCHVPKNGRKDR